MLAEDTRLSYSSASLLRGCETRYYHYKVAKTKRDPDSPEDTDAFIIGKSFHHILEMSKHEKPEKIGHLLEECVKKFKLPEEDTGLVHAMVLKYLRLHKKTNLVAVACEWEIKHPIVTGFIDVIFKEKDSDKWWIADLKTSKTFYATIVSRLPKDRQLNLYAAFYREIAKDLKLDPDAFQGCRYRVTTKSEAKQKKLESYNDYVLRITESNVKSYDVIVPIAKMAPKEVLKEHLRLHQISMLMRTGDYVPTQNFGNCETYFKPCEYWSKCHGECFSKLKEDLTVLIEGVEK